MSQTIETANILLVDDDLLFRSSASIILDQFRDVWTVYQASSVQEATAILESHRIDLAILDVYLPDGTAADIVRAAGLMPCMLCTRDIADETFRQMFEKQEVAHNIVGYLPKPLPAQAIWQVRAGYLIGKSRMMRDRLIAEATAKHEDGCRVIERNLHDAIGASLAQTTWVLSGIDKALASSADVPAGLEDTIRKLTARGRSILQATHAEVSKILKELRPEEVVVTSLKHAIEFMVAEWQAVAPGVTFRCRIADEVHDIDIRRAATIFRLVQEGITNAMRHAAPRVIDVELTCRKQQLLVQILSEGEIPTQESETYALTILRERTASLGGMLQFTCSAADGTSRLKILIPLYVPTASAPDRPDPDVDSLHGM